MWFTGLDWGEDAKNYTDIDFRGRAGLGGEVHALHGGFGLRAARDEGARREGGGDVPEFQMWIQSIQLELQEIVDRTGDHFVADTLEWAKLHYDGWNDKKYFTALKGKLIAMRGNIEKYYAEGGASEVAQTKAPKIFISHSSKDKNIVENGLIHTVDVDVNNETFEATCSVSGIKLRRINKTVNRYIPVLFLDTLKVSTIEQTAQQTSATGGKGNAQLIIWDYGKEITLTLQDALYSPASMSAMLGSYEGNDFTKGVKETKRIDRTEKCVAKRSFIVPAGNSKGVPSEGENTAQAVYIDLNTMQPYQDGAPIAEGETYLKWTRSVAYGDNSLGNTIEISAEKFPGTYKVVGDTFARNKTTGEDQRFQFVIPQAKMSSEQTITLESEGDPTVFDMKLTVLRPDDGVMIKLIQYDVVENSEENDGSTMVKDTENLNLLDDAEMFKVTAETDDTSDVIGATEY